MQDQFSFEDLAERDTEPAPPLDVDVETSRLPRNSAERKKIPMATGLIDYFPATIEALSEIGLMITPSPASQVLRGLLFVERPEERLHGCLSALVILQTELIGYSPRTKVASLCDLFDNFAEALAEVAKVSWYGNEKHNPGQPLHHARWKSTDHADCIVRHLVERGGRDGEMLHTACLVWRCMALDQQMREAEGAPIARGARLTPYASDEPEPIV